MIFKKFPKDWYLFLDQELDKTYINTLNDFLETAYTENTCYPPLDKLFTAFEHTNPLDVKVVILGQDPYHGKNQANGLSFSVEKTQKIPSSLRNIYQEIATDIEGFEIPKHGDLSHWAKQGVLLLNTTMSVQEKTPKSHQKQGWETFTDTVIKKLSEKNENIVFMLWGKFAQSKEACIDTNKHLILSSGHPSFANMHKKWFGNQHFSQCNAYLQQLDKEPIKW